MSFPVSMNAGVKGIVGASGKDVVRESGWIGGGGDEESIPGF